MPINAFKSRFTEDETETQRSTVSFPRHPNQQIAKFGCKGKHLALGTLFDDST